MVSKCANPECSTPFQYLRDGKVFQLEVGIFATKEPHPLGARRPAQRFEHFWLCGHCAPTMTLVLDKEGGVVAVPITPPPQIRRAAAS